MSGKLVKFTKLFLDIMFFSGFVVLVTLPFSLKMLIKYYYDSMDEQFFFLFVIFAVSGISGILIVNELRRMMRTVINESCFIYDNVKSLNKMAILSICISIMFLIKLFVFPTPASGVIILVFFIAALFSEVLSHVFAQAVNYKEENDLTI